jgi:thioredoxin-like negative regulator of GroEL
LGIPEQTGVRRTPAHGNQLSNFRPPPRRFRISTAAINAQKPGLVFFYSPVSGSCRRVEGFLAQVLQRRRNHGTFKLYRVDEQERPDLVERFAVATMPTLVVVEGKSVRARLERPRGCREIERFLAPWLK